MPSSANQSGSTSPPTADGPKTRDPAAADVPDVTPTPGTNGGKRGNKSQPKAVLPVTTTAPAAGSPKPSYITVLNRDRPMAWVVLAALLALGALPIYIQLHADRALSDSQSQSLTLAQETWQHRHMLYQGEVNLESMVPVSGGQPLLDRPPGGVWLNQLAFAKLDPFTATQADLTRQMRLMSAAFGLLTIAAIFWAGFSIGGIKTASYAGLVALSCPVLAWFARLGTAEVPLLGFQALAVASAMWALRPLRPSPSVQRQALGWTVCGGALGAAVLTGGLPAIPTVILPILVTSVMCPNRISHVLGLVASVCIAGLMVMPWAMYVHSQDTGIWEVWVAELWPERLQSFTTLGQSLYDRSALTLVLVVPWTLWLLGSLAQPFSASSRGARRRVFIGWAWLMSLTLLVVIGPGPSGLAGMLILLPAAAILIGQCLRLYSDRSAEGRHARVWRYTRWAHMALFASASVAIPLGMCFQDALVDRGILTRQIAAPMPWYFWLGLAVSLLLITAMSMRFALRHYPGKATICWSVWSVVMVSVTLIPLSRGPLMQQSPGGTQGETQQQTATIPGDV
jgi:4-amino-4-deoxy-L-arabinose transferase-like glycosyltransferase